VNYPRSMYRLAADGFEYEGRFYAMLTVHSADEEAAAKADGWRGPPSERPLDHDHNGVNGGSLPKRKPKKVKRNGKSSL
jgi:hypothetical protein